MNFSKSQFKRLTFWGTVDDLMLLLGVLEDTLRAEHFLIIDTVELYFLGGMLLAELDCTLWFNTLNLWVCGGCHWQTSENLIVHWQIVNCQLMACLVIGTLDCLVLR